MRLELTAPAETRVFERFVPSAQAFVMDQNSFGVIKNISLGGLAVYCAKSSDIEHSAALELFIERTQFSLTADQYTLISQRLTPGQAIIINHIGFNNLSASQLDSLWDLLKKNCLCAGAEHPSMRNVQKIVSFERHSKSQDSQAILANGPHLVSQNNDTTPLFIRSTIQ